MDGPGTTEKFSSVTVDVKDETLTALARPGQGIPIVIVHGVIADAVAWKQVAGKVAPERPALVLNRRGRVPSAPLSEGYGVETEVQDLLRWLSTLEGPVDLVGHSYGGLIAVQAIREGANIRSLVLYEPVAHPFGLEALPLVAAAISAGDLDAAVEIINVDLSGYTQAHVQTLRAGSSVAEAHAAHRAGRRRATGHQPIRPHRPTIMDNSYNADRRRTEQEPPALRAER